MYARFLYLKYSKLESLYVYLFLVVGPSQIKSSGILEAEQGR